MANETANIDIIIGAKDLASSVISGVGNSVKKISEDVTASSRKLSIGLTAAAAAATAFGIKAVQAFNESELVTQKLEKLTLNQTGATWKNVDALKQQAIEMAHVGVYSKELVMAAQAQFTTFDLTSDTIRKLIPSFLDMMASEKGVNVDMETMKETANGFAKAMVGSTDVLVKQGFVFTELQKKILATGTQQEKLKVITEVLGHTYNGMNNAMRNTFEGSMVVAKSIIGDFQQAIGQLIVKFIGPLIQRFIAWNDRVDFVTTATNFLNKALETFRDNLPAIIGALAFGLLPEILSIAGSIINFLNPAFLLLIASGVILGPKINDLVAAHGGLVGVIKILHEWIGFLQDRISAFWNSEPVQKIRGWVVGLRDDFLAWYNDPATSGILLRLEGFIPTLSQISDFIGRVERAIHDVRVAYEDWSAKWQNQGWILMFQAAVENVKNAIHDLWSDIVILARHAGVTLPENIKLAKLILEIFVGAVYLTIQAVATIVRAIDGFVIVCDKIITAMQRVIAKKREFDSKLSSMPGGGILRFLGFQTGGIVPGRPGEPVPIIAHGGERISNPNLGQNYNNTNNFQMQISLDSEAAVYSFFEKMAEKERASKFGVANA